MLYFIEYSALNKDDSDPEYYITPFPDKLNLT